MNKRVRKFLSLPTADQSLLLQSAFLLGAITLGLRVLSFQTLHSFLTGATHKAARSRQTDQLSPERIARAVRVVSRYIPAATCLTQALAIQVLLARWGYPTRLRIGVAKEEGEQLEAHAWVESQGEIVIGGPVDLSRYTPLPLLEGEGR